MWRRPGEAFAVSDRPESPAAVIAGVALGVVVEGEELKRVALGALRHAGALEHEAAHRSRDAEELPPQTQTQAS